MKTNKYISQQINFTGKLKEDDGEKQQKAITFFFRFINCH